CVLNRHTSNLQIAKTLIYFINYFKPSNQRFDMDYTMLQAFKLSDCQHDVTAIVGGRCLFYH
ncbi:MAG: hypothetical protein KAI17_02660, partial [Thiotrichaceae bacterium]|nr:hypothetical protein [Thiotrichaceae bacterium]